ncbi:MAG: Zn-dependent alcohol dehydrogenase [Myxococcales bacterium]|nr:Zn-dependent alcohol dehydrogenase [Myxococcales bacterium]MDD9968174.1 Zn-dependent alcohol dehydrogenase [Myxococcales bacterium]
MKAAVLEECGKPLVVQDVELGAPARREVVVRTAFAGLCHSDLHFITGDLAYRTPCVAGHESAGVVEAVGADVTYVKPGDHVISCLSVFCGQCKHCLSGNPHRCGGKATARPRDEAPRISKGGAPVHQFMHLSSFAERMLVHENAIVKVRPDMPLDRAALIGCGVTTGVGAVLRTANVEAGATVAVIGCGGIGLAAVNGAVLASASRIVAIDRLPEKLELARQFGATDVVDASEGDVVERVKELTAGGVNYSFEAIGLTATVEQAFNMLRAGGTATVIGMTPMGAKVQIHGLDLLSEKKLQGSNMGSNRFRLDMPILVDFYLSGRLTLDPLISSRISLDEINAGMDRLKTGAVARQLIAFPSPS